LTSARSSQGLFEIFKKLYLGIFLLFCTEDFAGCHKLTDYKSALLRQTRSILIPFIFSKGT